MQRHQKILNHGFVTLEESFGNDLTIVNAARTSFNVKKEKLDEKDIGLLNYLLENRHGSPLEQVNFRFTVKCPISVMREWIRHRMASYNERSGRYTKLDPDFYVPDEFRTQKGKSGHYLFKPIEDHNDLIQQLMKESYERAWSDYNELLDAGVAKELARNVLPVGIYTKFVWNINLRSLFNFLSLRTDERAMWEIRQYANAIEEMIKEVVPYTWEAWNKNGRSNP
jgi:thymidylate synthase (FAD)